MSQLITSRQNLRILLAVGEEITSISDILVNGATIEDQDIAFAYTKGGPNQPIITGFESVVSSVSQDFALVTETDVTHSVPKNPNLTIARSVEVGFYFEAGLYRGFKSGNHDKTYFNVEVYTRKSPNGGPDTPWSKAQKNYRITKHSLSATRGSFLIRRPEKYQNPDLSWTLYGPNDNWEIKIKRLTPNSDEPGTSGKTFYINKCKVNFTAYASAKDITYAGTALLALWVEDLSTINNSFPQITVKAKGFKFYVPASNHYNLTTKEYYTPGTTDPSLTTPWDGTFSRLAYTNNLSYQIYSLLSNKMVKTVPISEDGSETYTYMLSFGVEEEDLGINSFYQFAKYCDSLFNGKPRYACNKQFIDLMPSREFVNTLLSIGNAKLTRKHGLLCVVWDKKLSTNELASVPIIIPEMTDKGFELSRTDLTERYTHFSAIYEDLDNNNVVASAQADAVELAKFLKTINWLGSGELNTYFVDKFGYRQNSVELVGATYHSTALIKARGVLWDALVGNEFIAFTGGYEFSSFYEGQIIGTIDSSLSMTKQTGRIASYEIISGLYHITLDSDLILAEADYVYFYLKDPATITEENLNPTEIFRQIAPVRFHPHTSNFNIGETSKSLKTWVFALTSNPIDNTPFFKVESNLRYWTITNIDFNENKFAVRAKVYYTEKFDFIDTSYTVTPATRLYKVLPKVVLANPEVTFKVQEGLSSAQILVAIWFNHTLPLTISHNYVITYDIRLNMLGLETKRILVDQAYTAHDATEVEQVDLTLTTNALTITQTHFAQLEFTVQNFKSYFDDLTGIQNTLDVPFELSIVARTKDALSGIKPSPKFVLQDSVTFAKPDNTSSDFIQVGN